MGQPVVAKIPAYQLEGDGERILNKKKLDELVRQVCGGTAEGQEGNLLTPEVEEVSSNMHHYFASDPLPLRDTYLIGPATTASRISYSLL